MHKVDEKVSLVLLVYGLLCMVFSLSQDNNFQADRNNIKCHLQVKRD